MKPAGLLAARAALERGAPAAARDHAVAVVRQFPDQAEAHFLIGLAEAAEGRVSAGIGHLQRAVALEGQGEYWAQLARLLSLVHRDGEAAHALAAAERGLPGDALSLDTMGCVYARLGDHAAAVPHFTAAVRLAPNAVEFRYNLGAALSFVGRVDEAEAAFEDLLSRAPLHARAHYALSGLRRQSAGNNHVTRLASALREAKDEGDRLLLRYSLAKEAEDLGRSAEAFEHLAAANRAQRASLRYDPANDERLFEAVEQAWAVMAPGPGVSSAAPIFVVGMPRTGTTLVERILSSHPAVDSAGELQAMPLAVKAASGVRTRTVIDPETLIAAAARDPAEIGRAYLDRARHHHAGEAPHFIDKLPANFFYIGFIARALPQARIVCLRRHPLDTLISNYKHLFGAKSAYYDYAYDLMDIAAYYLRFDRLMAFWRAVVPGRVLELSYEQLVADQEGGTRRLLDHCGLAWSDRCLDFHANAAPVATPSAAQVRRPIYSDAIGRWRKHSEALAEARAWLEARGVPVD